MMNLRGGRNVPKLALALTLVGAGSIYLAGSWLGTARSQASASGPSPSFTGAPLESNCTACHSTFEVNSGEGNITISGLPKSYLPGQQIPITVTVNDSTGVLFGFQMTAVTKDGTKAGDFVVPAPSPVPIMQLVTGFVNGNNRQYIEHTIQGVTPSVAGTKSWHFTWTAPAQRIGKLGFYAAGNAANSDSSSDNDLIYTTSKAVYSGSPIASFDNDGATDYSLFRPSDGVWYSLNSSGQGGYQVQFGTAGDVPTPGDYDGDGVTDRAVFRPSEGNWYLLLSSGGITGFQWGAAGDIPVAADYDGDGKTDPAVFRPSEGLWYVLKSTGGNLIVQWGLSSDIAAHGDYDGDAKTDFAVYRPSEGLWYILGSASGFSYAQFGLPEDLPVQADYDGDGRCDVAVYRPSTGAWWMLRSSLGLAAVQFGNSVDVPSPGDYDGDGLADITVYRPSEGNWYTIRSSDLAITGANWGLAGDISVPSAYLDR